MLSRKFFVKYSRPMATVLIFVIWESYARMRVLSESILSTASAAIWQIPELAMDRVFLSGVSSTLASFLGGLIVASVVGITVGMWWGFSRLFSRVMDPYLAVLMSAPKVVFLPIFLLIFGFGLESNVFFAAFLSVFPILVATRSSVVSVKPILLTVAKVFGAKRSDIFEKVVLPATLHSVISGLRIGAITTMTGVIISELFAGSAGLGYLVGYYGATYQVSSVYATILIIALISIAINEFFIFLEKKTTRWAA